MIEEIRCGKGGEGGNIAFYKKRKKNMTLEQPAQIPTYLNQVHVPLIPHFPRCHKFCFISWLSKRGKKNMAGSLPTARCSLLFDVSVIMGHSHLQEVAACFSLIHNNFFREQ